MRNKTRIILYVVSIILYLLALYSVYKVGFNNGVIYEQKVIIEMIEQRLK